MSKKIKLAFIAPDVLSEFHKRQLAWLYKHCEKQPVSITIISPVILMTASKESKKCAASFFRLISGFNYDGFIISSNTLLNIFGEDFCNETIERLSKKPAVSLSYYSDKCCSILIDNKSGMENLINHFIDFHNYTKIGFVRGKKDHSEAEERYNTFVKCMKRAHLPINKKWIFEGNFQSKPSQYLISDFLRRNEELPEAIIAVNDNSAVGILNALKEHPIETNIAVGGFDNIISADYLGLTTVDQLNPKQIDLAVQSILDLISGKKIKPLIKIDPALLIRSSCGCLLTRKARVKRKTPLFRDDETGGFNLGYLTEFSRNSANNKNLSDFKKSLQILFEELRINRANIYLFNEGDPIFTEEENISGQGGKLFFRYKQWEKKENHKKSNNDSITLTQHIDQITPKDNSSLQMICNLYFKTEYYGHLIIELDEQDPLLVEMIKQEIEAELHNLYIQRTLQKTMEQLKNSVSEKQNLLNLLAHDINNPLFRIINSLEIMKNELPKEQIISEHFNIAQESVICCSNIINDILTLQKFKSEKIPYPTTKIDIKNFCRELSKEFKQAALEKKIPLCCQESFDNSFFTTNREMLKSIIRNLLSNAIKYSSEGKAIDISLNVNNKILTFEICDKGQGFSEKDKQKLFTPFESLSSQPTGSEPSTGLGLSLVKVLTDRLNGNISLRSEKGKGSCFTVVIPETSEN